MNILKFGGKSLANGKGINNVLNIIKNHSESKEKFVLVLSARANTTELLESFIEKSKNNIPFKKEWEDFKKYQIEPCRGINLNNEFTCIKNLLEGIWLLKDYSLKTKDLVLAQGELLSIKLVSKLLENNKLKNVKLDSRNFIKTDSNFSNATINSKKTKAEILKVFNKLKENTIPIITGFIGSDEENNTTTLGKNGSNYTASLLADFLNAKQIISYTHVDGVYTANPEIVEDALLLNEIDFDEANELASFGVSILHPKTILPLKEKQIPLRICNTFNKNSTGTLIHKIPKHKKGIKCICLQENVGLINIEGDGLLHKKNIDSRIFSVLGNNDISINIISQGSSERGVNFTVENSKKELAVELLKKEFKQELLSKTIKTIKFIKNVSSLTIVGLAIADFYKSLKNLKANKVSVRLINNTLNNKNINLIIDNKDIKKAINSIHQEIFGASKNVHIAIVGKGNVGTALINQIFKAQTTIYKQQKINLKIIAIANSSKIILNKKGLLNNWEIEFNKAKKNLDPLKKLLQFAENEELSNLIFVDNTSSFSVVAKYKQFVDLGFNLISSNKLANTQSYLEYKTLRNFIEQKDKQYLYETNVGAGLPIIDTIKLLHQSGEKITKIRGVFSGSLSSIFNQFSEEDIAFSECLNNAIKLGYTEPNPKDDLSGIDVARKLLVLAREIGLENEFTDIKTQNLIPEELQKSSKEEFLKSFNLLNKEYSKQKQKLQKNQVLRYIATLSCKKLEKKGDLKVQLETAEKSSVIGSLKNNDSIFEIYTESYGKKPITIIGAGAGAEVTARGVFGDILRIVK